ncbi:MAG: hypothetical protein IT365_26045, partial [Candidatus Hydrogenedentes bacterium]|nr:hypothetical protein [Candidatus Hydrogenedentota bacterium]
MNLLARTLLAVAMLVPFGHAADLTVQALAAGAPPLIDGKLDDAVWQDGEWASGFSLLDKPEAIVEVQTRFKVAMDASNVYFAVRADEPDMANQVKTIAERDGKVYLDECVEIMVGADPEGSRYLHFIVNPLGAVFDEELFNEGNEANQTWDSGCTVGVALEPDAWTLELAVPIVDIGVSVRGEGGWILNVARERRSGQVEELSSFAPLTGGFHQPTRYAALQLPEVDLSPLVWGVRYPYEIEVRPEGDALTCTSKTFLENQTGAFRFFAVRPKWRVGDAEIAGPDVLGGLDAGQSKEVTFAFPVPQHGVGTLSIEVRDRANPDSLWAVRKRQMTLEYVPIIVNVTRPHYRNNIYATESLDAIQASIQLAVSAEQRAGANLLVSLAAESKPGEPVAQQTFPANEDAMIVSLPTPELEVGRYLFAVALQRNEKTFARAETIIRKLPKVDHEWRLDENNVLLHNGEPFLPFGWFAMPAEEMAKPDCPYNAAHDYNAHWYSVEKNRATLDAFAAAGKVLTIDPYPSHEMTDSPALWGQPLSEEDAEGVRQRVRALKGHPGLFAWYMADEPELVPALPERMRQLREVVAEEDPYHPCIMLNDTIAGIYKYVDGGDVLMPDPYPCFVKGGLAAVPIEKVSEFMRAARDAAQGRRALWITPQAFNYGDYGRENNRAPTFTELRNMTYQAVVEGTKGFLYYLWGDSLSYMDLRVGMPFLAKEIADLKGAILAPDVVDAVQVEAPLKEDILCSARKTDEQVYVFAVNTAPEPQQVALALGEALGAVEELHVVSEGRALTRGEDGRFSDAFGSYATHVYSTNSALAQRESVVAAQAEVDKLDAARRKAGNVAFEESGVAVKVSSKSLYGSVPARIVDGVEDGMGWRDNTPDVCPDWVDLEWPAPVEVGRVVVWTGTVEDLAVLVP